MSSRSSAQPKPLPGLVLGGEPRVNLLPPEVFAASKARGTRRLLVALVAVVVLLVGGGYAFAFLRAATAQADLAAAQGRTAALIAEQQQYADATRLATLVTASTTTRVLATSMEIIWADVFDEVAAFLPPNAFSDWSAAGVSPWEAVPAPAGVLRQPRVASITLVISSPTPLDATALFRRLAGVEGFVDASIDKLVLADVGATYETTITINLGSASLSDRFLIDNTQETSG